MPTHFVKAKTWALGPITISQPVMMTMSLDGLVRAAPPGADVIGIVGYDIFRYEPRSGRLALHKAGRGLCVTALCW